MIKTAQNTKANRLLMRILTWREDHISERSFLLILAFVVGVLSGFAALLLKFLISIIASTLSEHINITGANYLYLLYPVLGILIVGIYVRYVVKDNISHGVTRVLYAISQNKSRLKLHNTYTSVVASSITIGFGGSVGAEGPIVNTGAAIGSNLGSLFRMSPQILMMLVGSGAAAGVAGIFKAPIAGMLFAIEVLMIDLTTVSVMPLLISSITAATVSYIFTGYSPEFVFDQSEAFLTNRIPYTIVLGIVCGFTSLYFTKVIGKMESLFSKIHNPWYKFAFGGVILSGLIFCFPPLYGEGYEAITDLLTGDPSTLFDGSVFYSLRDNVWFVLLFLLMIILTKVFATSATNGGGGVGGTFAPSLYVGCMTGFFFAYLVN
ncbi:MAG: chloride channel protein, partial [Bacteroidales bacterium]|nr:chloride channel protein [Bacteroidales bacterium]